MGITGGVWHRQCLVGSVIPVGIALAGIVPVGGDVTWEQRLTGAA
jgi:hypothetical protein